MANLTFKEAYDEDQLRPEPIGDLVTADAPNDYVGVTAADPNNGGALTDIGMTLAQLRTAIDRPAYVYSAIVNIATDGLGTLEELLSVPIPAGFGQDDTIWVTSLWNATGSTGTGMIARIELSGASLPCQEVLINGDQSLLRRFPIELAPFGASTIHQFLPADIALVDGVIDGALGASSGPDVTQAFNIVFSGQSDGTNNINLHQVFIQIFKA